MKRSERTMCDKILMCELDKKCEMYLRCQILIRVLGVKQEDITIEKESK